MPEKTKIFKKKIHKIWAGIIAAVIVLFILVPITLANREYRQDVVGNWLEVVNESDMLGTKFDAVTDEESARNFVSELDTLSAVLDRNLVNINQLSDRGFWVVKNKKAKKVLEEYIDYLNTITPLFKEPTAFNNKEYQDAVEKMNTLQVDTNDMVRTTFLSNPLPSKIYVIPDRLKDIRDDWQKNQELEAEKKSKEEAVKAKQAQDEADVFRNVTKFMDAYIAGNREEMERYMTDAFINEFNFDVLNNRQYAKPENFRITSITKKTEVEYEVLGVELVKTSYTDQNGQKHEGKYTNNRKFRVVFSQKYNVWLVDSFELSGGQ